GTCIDMALGSFFGQEQTGRFHNDLCSDFIPFQVGGALFGSNADFLAIDYQFTIPYFHLTLELAMSRIIFKHISHIVRIDQVIDANYLNIISFLSRAKNQSTDSSEAVNTNFNLCHNLL